MNRIGIDLGGTKIEGILLSDTNKVIERKRIQTKQEEGYNSIINRIVKLITNIRSRSDKECQIGICTPGALDLETGILKNSNLVGVGGWERTPLGPSIRPFPTVSVYERSNSHA